METIDAHLHLHTAIMFRRMLDRMSAYRAPARERVRARGRTFQERIAHLESVTLADQAAMWLDRFDTAGVQAGLFIAMGEANEELAEFIRMRPERLIGCGSLIDPAHPDAARTVRRFPSMGIRALKLYAPTLRIHLNDRIVYPVYEAAAECGLPVIVHFGVTVGAMQDLMHANPLALSAPCREFPDVTFVVAHFGAGFLRETLLIAYHTENVCVDTSGTNNWRLYLPGEPSLEQVFRDTLRVYGPSRILFGTDSTFFSGFREEILDEQRATLDRIGLSDEDRALILSGNARRIFGIAT